MATTGERNTTEREGRVFSHPLANDAVINRGAMVALEAGAADAGYAAAGIICVGVAQSSAVAADGDEAVNAKLGTFLFANSTTDAVDETNIGSDCFMEDDETVAASDNGGTLSRAGTIRALEGNGVWVEFS